MKKPNWIARPYLDMIAILCLLAPGLQAASAQDYPSRPIRIISPVPAGGLSDVALRPVAHELSKSLGQTVIVDNRPGAGGTLAGRACAQAPADGYTICNFFNDVISNAPFLFKNLAYDPYRDFTPITNGYFITAAFLVSPSLNVGSMAELIALSKSRPEGLNYASPSTGATMFIEKLQPAYRRKAANHPVQERRRGGQRSAHQQRTSGGGRHRHARAASSGGDVQGACGRLGGALAAAAQRSDVQGDRL
jgi:tripartite tricarboxylate transporter family receptor